MTQAEQDYYLALNRCGERYRDMYLARDTAEASPEWQFIMLFLFGCRDRKPVMKLNRWLGYIQRCVIARGWSTVDIERGWSSNAFRDLDAVTTVGLRDPGSLPSEPNGLGIDERRLFSVDYSPREAALRLLAYLDDMNGSAHHPGDFGPPLNYVDLRIVANAVVSMARLIRDCLDSIGMGK